MGTTKGAFQQAFAILLPCVSLLANAVAGSAQASALDEVLSAHASGMDAAALASIQSLANSGDAAAQYKLGVMYARGWALDQSYAQAKLWYEKSASQDFTPAEVALGAIYMNGFAGPRDLPKAAYWWRRAADQDDPIAKANLTSLQFLISNIKPSAAPDVTQATQVTAGQLHWDRVPTSTEMDALFPPLGAEKKTVLKVTLKCAAVEDGTLSKCVVVAENALGIGLAEAAIKATKICRLHVTDELVGEIRGAGLVVTISFAWKPPALSQQ
jgi:hypothetical protein